MEKDPSYANVHSFKLYLDIYDVSWISFIEKLLIMEY